jgi:citrate lyase subunit alpha/citrate CoA-transferase
VILAVPSFRDRIPVLVDELTTLCGPGELIDVVVTERGIAINPRRRDLIDATRNAGLPLRSLQEIQHEVLAICGGKPDRATVDTTRPIAVVKWVDGSLLDTIYKVQSG